MDQQQQQQQPIDLRVLEEAVVVFYRSNSTEQAAAHDWLTKAQCSQQAWSFVWDLMQPNKSSEVQFFGASTLHSKLMKYWHEVPAENHEELKQKLLETIITFGSGPKIVLNRLCIALSALIVNMLDKWPTAIEDVTNTFQNQQLPNINANTQIWVLMEVLCGIPEEINAIYTSTERATRRFNMDKHVPFILRTIEQYISVKCELPLKSDEMTTLLRASKCAGVWVKIIGIPLDSCQHLASSLVKLINKCYWNSAQSDGCMSADENEVTESCLETLTSMMVQPDAHKYSNTALGLMNLFLESLSQITKAEWTENNLNEDIAVGIYTLFVSSIECHSRLLLAGVITESANHRDLYMRLIHEILQCTDKPGIYPVEESCSPLALGFWYMLQDEILSKDNDLNRTKCLELITPLYSHLSKILVRKAQQPDESSIDKWSSDDLESFRCYRQDVSDTLMYCNEVLHDHLLEILSVVLDESIVTIQNDSTNWTQLEACIFSFYSLAEHVDIFENKHIPKLMNVIHEIPYDKLNEKILGTALETIGAYCDWFKANPSYLPAATELLVKGLNSSMAPQATLGLKDLCRECQIEMRGYAEPLLNACQQSLLSGHLKNSESVRLMYSIGKIMSVLPVEKILPCLDLIVSPCFEELQQIIQSRNFNDPSKIRTIFRLNMISTLFSSLNTNLEDKTELSPQELLQQLSNPAPKPTNPSTAEQPVLFVMQKTMPILEDIGKNWIKEPEVIEGLCNALKHAIVNLMNDFKPMLPELCRLVISIIQSKCVPPVEIAQRCIILFYKDEQCQSTMRQLFFEVINFNCNVFDQTPENSFSEISDLVESFCSFNSRIVSKLPVAYTDTNIDCGKLILYAIKAITLPETGSVQNGITFLTHFVTQSRGYKNIYAAVLEKGQEIIRTVLLCIGGITPRTHVDNFASIFVAINKNFPAEFIVWLKILEAPQFPTHFASDKYKEQFVKSIIRERVNKRLVQFHIRTFAAISRGIEKV